MKRPMLPAIAMAAELATPLFRKRLPVTPAQLPATTPMRTADTTALCATLRVDPPGSLATHVSSIEPAGAIAGYYQDASSADRGYVRDAHGGITTFDFPGSLATLAGGNANGATAGDYLRVTAGHLHGFVRSQGNFTSFDPRGSIQTLVQGINSAGSAGQHHGLRPGWKVGYRTGWH
ncbi:MAG: hypothetical protein ABSF64_29045 [Bryobacteraceae bacterium]|jgi:hypothetical protein